MRCHEVDYHILGSDMQAVDGELDPGEIVVAEAGAMTWMDDGVDYQAKMKDGSDMDSGFFGGDQKGEGSALGGIFRMLNGR
ncbi:MAG: AIM24 family protein [Desulfovermiculus sp.]|nr:AIM24 family protein [Desulfovermiculus sp.]